MTTKPEVPNMVWALRLPELTVDYGLHPANVPYGAFSLAVGVDGRFEGAVSRHPGFVQWMDLTSSQELAQRMAQGPPQIPYTTVGEIYRYPQDFFPFFTRQSDGNHLYGAVVWWNGYQTASAGEPVNSDPYIVWKEGPDYTDPWCTDYPGGAHASTGFKVERAETLTGTSAANNQRCWGWWPNAETVGRYLYVSTGAKYRERHIGCWFRDEDLEPSANNNWVFDFAGPLVAGKSDPFYLTAAVTAAADSYAQAGNYRFAYRLVNQRRGLYSNLVYKIADVASIDSELQYQSDGADVLATANDYFTITPSDNSGLAEFTPWTVSAAKLPIFLAKWPKWQFVSSISSGGTTVPGGGFMFVVDTLNTSTAFQGGTGGTTIAVATTFRLGTRAESGTAGLVPCTDASVITQEPVIDALDQYLNWHQMHPTFAMRLWQGLMVYISKGKTVTDDPESLATPGDFQRVAITWSDPRGLRPENVPVINRYETEWRLPQDPVYYADYGSSDISLMARVPYCLVPVGNYLYAFGDGPVYRLIRSASNLSGVVVEQISTAIVPVSQYAVASFGQAAVVVADTGVFLLDGASGSMVQMNGLNRLIRDRWSDASIQRTISCAYDSVMDAVYIVCAGTGEMVTVWLGSNTVTMDEGTAFRLVKSAKLPTRDQGIKIRALFMTTYGKLVYPEHLRRNGETYQCSMHGFRAYTDDMAVPPPLLKVSAYELLTSDDGIPVHRLILTDPEGGAVEFSSILTGGTTIGFLSGDLEGKIYPLHPRLAGFPSAPHETNDVYVRGDDLTSPNTVGSYVTLSPIRFTLVGGPLAGQVQRRFVERKHVEDSLPIVDNLYGDSTCYEFVPMAESGVCLTQATRNAEGSIPASDTVFFFKVSDAAFPQWLDPVAEGVYLADTPRVGREFDFETPTLNYGVLGRDTDRQAPASSVSGHTLLPVFTTMAPGFNFELLEWYLTGTLATSEKAR